MEESLVMLSLPYLPHSPENSGRFLLIALVPSLISRPHNCRSQKVILFKKKNVTLFGKERNFEKEAFL